MSKGAFLLAVDPGMKGAIAWRGNGVVGVQKIAVNPADLCLQLGELLAQPLKSDFICFLEEVGGYIGKAQPGSSAFKFGRQVGVIEGVLAAHQIEVRKIRPQAWQKALSSISRPGEEKNAHKRRLRALALELYPRLREQITLQTADALLILRAGEQSLL